MIILNDTFIGDARISQIFGINPKMYKKYGLKGHNGIDFACKTGTQLLAPFDGKIIEFGYDPQGYGNYVKIWSQKQRACILYGHLKSFNVKWGQMMKSGQLIGWSDNTGYSTGAHLHMGLCLTNSSGYRLNKNNGFSGYVNPLDKKIVKWVLKNPIKPVL